MVGSSPVDSAQRSIQTSNRSLPPGGAEAMRAIWSLCAWCPLAWRCWAAALLYFYLVWQSPAAKRLRPSARHLQDGRKLLADVYGIRARVLRNAGPRWIPRWSAWRHRRSRERKLEGAPLMLRDPEAPTSRAWRRRPNEMIWVGTVLGVMGTREKRSGSSRWNNKVRSATQTQNVGNLFNPTRAGIFRGCHSRRVQG